MGGPFGLALTKKVPESGFVAGSGHPSEGVHVGGIPKHGLLGWRCRE